MLFGTLENLAEVGKDQGKGQGHSGLNPRSVHKVVMVQVEFRQVEHQHSQTVLRLLVFGCQDYNNMLTDLLMELQLPKHKAVV